MTDVMIDVDVIGSRIYRAATFHPSDGVPNGGAIALANRVYDYKIVYEAKIVAEGGVHTIAGKTRICHRIGLPRARANFVVARLLGRLFLTAEDEWHSLHLEDQLRIEVSLAAWLVAPPDCFRAAIQQVGLNLRKLASEFTITETAAALRYGEVQDVDTIVTAENDPQHIHRHGRLLAWADQEDIFALARKSNPKSVKKARIYDEPGRTALFARMG